ncbi:MAG: HPr(Ser) kinase/phosphatase [Longimicrobiales bacterium]
MNQPLTVAELFQHKQQTLALELLTPDVALDRPIHSTTPSSPGLILAGFIDRAPSGRVQILGETEIRYLESLDDAGRKHALKTLFSLEMPVVIITKGLSAPAGLVQLARATLTPVICSQLKTGDVYRRLQPYLEERLAPATTCHGSLADVYGVGLLFTGRSGIGKSECVLDLVERGHRVVADDNVHITRRGNDILIGRGLELQGHHMEIRGIGIIDVRALFGIRAIRQQKRIEVVVQLEEWSATGTYDRTGLDVQEMDILGVKLPKVIMPLNSGKNLTVLSEVVAMNHLLKFSGVDSASLFNERLIKAMRPLKEYLEEDYE